jgi:hypothetical protein
LQLDAVATLGADGARYYRDVVLRRAGGGGFKVASAMLGRAAP